MLVCYPCLIFLIIFHLLSLTLQLVLWKTESVPFSNGVDYIVTEWQGECFYFFVLFLGGINLGTYGDRCSYSLHDNLRFFCQRIFQGSSLAYLWSLLPLLAKRTITDDSLYVLTPALKVILALDDAGWAEVLSKQVYSFFFFCKGQFLVVLFFQEYENASIS